MNVDEARAKLHARQEAEAAEMERTHARERADLELQLLMMTDRHRREFITLGRRQIAERDFMATATLATPSEAWGPGLGPGEGSRPPSNPLQET